MYRNIVNEMPLEIFCDYVSEQTNQEWTLETLYFIALNGLEHNTKHGHGCFFALHIDNMMGNSHGYLYDKNLHHGGGESNNEPYGWGDGFFG